MSPTKTGLAIVIFRVAEVGEVLLNNLTRKHSYRMFWY